MLVAEEENVEDGEGVVRPSKEIWPQAQWNQVYLSFFLFVFVFVFVYLCVQKLFGHRPNVDRFHTW